MAEFILKALVKAKGLEDVYHIESAAVSDEETGNPIYPPAKRCLSQHGVWFDPMKRARKVVPADYDRFDIRVWAATLPTRGTPATLKPPSRISWRGVRRCWRRERRGVSAGA